jgi:16S rRNA (guanine966-N2)-methyltransferase
MTRVIGGMAGGRRLVMPAGAGTRPTSDRTREGLFSTLTSLLGDLNGRPFLDLYAGSGAVGLEAASRGARPVALVERDQGALRALRSNVADLGLAEVSVHPVAVARFLTGEPAQSFDVVFADPPYADPIDAVLARLVDGGWLTRDAVVCVERATRGHQPAWPAGIEGLRSRRYGDSTLWYGRAL